MRKSPVMHKVRIVAAVLPLNLCRGNKNREQVKERERRSQSCTEHLRNERGKTVRKSRSTNGYRLIFFLSP